jgi:cell division protein FtsZ
MIHFDLPKDQSSIIKVIGVGGGGSNAVNHMHGQKIDGVDFIICNTDAQALAQSTVSNKIQLGPLLTQGLGAGANPMVGRQATEESLDEIKRILEVNTKMAFITAGMGGGTGTGGAPIIAKICKDLGILTVGIVTTPFAYEGRKRLAQAEAGVNSLKEYVDTLLVISNDKLRDQYGNLKMTEAFSKADNVLSTAAKCITDVISTTGQINVDFADVCTVMRNGGVAILGSASCEGDGRALRAVEGALNSHLLNDSDIKGAQWILININSSRGEHEFTMDEVDTIQNEIIAAAGDGADIILGLGYDESLEDRISITLIATGFNHKNPFDRNAIQTAREEKNKVTHELVMPKVEVVNIVNPLVQAQAPAIVEQKIEEEEIAEIMEPQLTLEEKDELMPRLVEKPVNSVEILSKTTVGNLLVEKTVGEQFFEISSSKNQSPAIEFDIPSAPIPSPKPNSNTSIPVSPRMNEQAGSSSSNAIKTGLHLAKPTQIYASDAPDAKSNSKDEPLPMQGVPRTDYPEADMQLVVKSQPAAEEAQTFHEQIQPNIKSTAEDLAMQDDADELRRRAIERIAKLRNLSFNTNANDPNNEFETVPAYLRRNLDLGASSVANVENFYSSYTVKTSEENKTEISTINTFLDGKKPD